MRKSPRFFFWITLAGLALRLVFVFLSPQVTDDSRIYADIATNWLTHGVYGISEAGHIVPTYIRLPEYPAFLAAVFAIFGKDNFRAVLLIQVVIDLATCFLIADLTRRTVGANEAQHGDKNLFPVAAKAAFLLSALCPFLANYAAAALTETLEIFFTALAFEFAVVALSTESRFAWGCWASCGLSIAAAILLRPDGGILLIAVGAYIIFLLVRFMVRVIGSTATGDRDLKPQSAMTAETAPGRPAAWTLVAAGILLLIFALAPLIPWTLRNVRTMHRFQPLTPRYANNPADYVPVGFDRWVKTWMADYVSVQEIYWQEPGEEIDPEKLPSRAFDSPEQRQRTLEVLNRYNQKKDIDQTLDAEFDALARERIRAAPMRYYAWLPVVRIADMWLRPRTELTQADPRWWEFNDDIKYSVLSVSFGVINLAYVLLALIALACRVPIRWLGMFLLFVIVRSIFLGTLENPETRYTLECYPVLIVFAAAAVRRTHLLDSKSKSENS